MLRLRRMHSLQKFASVHGKVHNHLGADRSLASRDHDKATRTVALAEGRQRCTG
jgi:putative transposase